MITQNNLLNARTARRIVGQRLFGPEFDGTATAYRSLSPADQIALNDELAWYIVYEGNPVSFAPEQIAAAQRHVSRPHFRTALADPGFSMSEFGDAMLSNAAGLSGNFGETLSKAAAVATVVVALIAVLRYMPEKKG